MKKELMLLISIVELDRGKKLIKELKSQDIRINFQTVGYGTAPTELMDIFGLGSNDKDVVLSLGGKEAVEDMLSSFGETFASHSKYGGLMIVVDVNAASRLLTEILNFNYGKSTEKGGKAMKREAHNNLIVLSVNEGFTEDVMRVARQAGATGGTVIKGRLDDAARFAEIVNTQVEDEREIILILSPTKASEKIMEEVNREFGLLSPAAGILFSVPVDKAYKI